MCVYLRRDEMSETVQMNKSSTMRIDLIPDISEIPLAECPKASFVTVHQKKAVPQSSGDGVLRGYSELFQSVYDAGVITDLRGRIRDVNRRALDAFGYTAEGFGEVDIFKIIAGSDDELIRTLYENVQHERFTLMQAYCIRADNSAFPAEIAVSQIRLSTPHLVFFIRDITLRRQTDEMLRTEHNALQNASDAIVVIDMNSRIEYANPATARLWHFFEAGDLVGRDLGDLFENSRDGHIVMDSLSGEHYSVAETLTAKRYDGESFRVRVNAACNRNSDGEVVGAVLSFIDLTDRDRVVSTEKAAKELSGALGRIKEYRPTLANSLEDMSSFLRWIASNSTVASDSELNSKVQDAMGVWEGYRALVSEIREIIDTAATAVAAEESGSNDVL